MIGKDKKTVWKRNCSNPSVLEATLDFDPILGTAVDNLNTVLEFFNFFIDDFIIDKIVSCTNKRFDDQKPVTAVEIRGFFGLLLFMGVTKKHDIEISEIYKSSSIHYSDWATVCMSRDRFYLISAKITFDDVDTRTLRFLSNPRLHKINEVFDRLTNQTVYTIKASKVWD